MKFCIISYCILISALFSDVEYFEKISDYKIFIGDPHNLETNENHTPYDLITPLFTDYAFKHRTIYIPENKKIDYNDKDSFNFPIGTIISKTFYYPHDFDNINKGISLKETRILIHEPSGWVGLPYVWNIEETEAYLEITGGMKNIKWKNINGDIENINYIIPNMNQCKGCHMNVDKKFLPIGTKARNINSFYDYGSEIKNQIVKWNELEYFKEIPNINNLPKVAKWNDPSTGNLDERARAWLDINCAHCHNYKGSANNTGLFLDYYQNDKKALGYYKTPVAAGRGSGDLKYDIAPGDASSSILIYRYNSTDPGVMMPELGRTMVHKEGLELLRKWINNIEVD